MRRDFVLDPKDVEALDALGCSWETVRSGGVRWIIIHDFPLPAGYNVSQARVAIRIDTYPPGIIDMAYFLPPLSRADSKVINNLSQLAIDGATYQQWSRHYSWRAGTDTLGSHIRRVRSWLKHELRKR